MTENHFIKKNVTTIKASFFTESTKFDKEERKRISAFFFASAKQCFVFLLLIFTRQGILFIVYLWYNLFDKRMEINAFGILTPDQIRI